MVVDSYYKWLDQLDNACMSVFAHVMLLEIWSWIMVLHRRATRQVVGSTQQSVAMS